MDDGRLIHRAILATIVVVTCSHCGGGGGGGGSGHIVPPEATMAQTTVKTQMTKFTPFMAGAESSLLLMLNPGAGQTPGVTVQADTSPGAPPHAFLLSGTYDGNADGTAETTVSGRVTYGGDPASLQWSPASGHVDLDVHIPVGGHVYASSLDFRITMTDVQLSGSGSFTNPVSGETTSITLPAGTPLVVKAVNAQNGAAGNACGYNLSGTVPVQMTGPTGTYKSNWVFSSGSTSVDVQQATFTDPSGKQTALADSTTTLTCGETGSLRDWEAVYDQHWVCLPLEYGNARITITASGTTALTIDDEDPPGSGDIATYSAASVGASLHAVKGFFDGGPAGNHYREHFTWSLDKDGNFSDRSTYTYTEGANTGLGGICAARALR